MNLSSTVSSSSQQIPDLRIVHLHIPKTAGTSIRLALSNVLSPRLCAPHIADDADAEKYFGTGFRLYSGHFGFTAAEALNGEVVTILRDPFHRCISTYLFWRKLYANGIDSGFKTKLASDYSLLEFFKIQDEILISEEFFNRMTFQLCSSSSIKGRRDLRIKGMSSSDIYSQAMANLETCRLIGFQDDLASFNSGLSHLVGQSVQIERLNITGKEPVIDYDLTREERASIERHLEMDIQLYHDAKHQFAEQK